MKNERQNLTGTSYQGFLFLLFLTLKLTGNSDWSWIWVFSPLWITVAINIVFVIIGAIIRKYKG